MSTTPQLHDDTPHPRMPLGTRLALLVLAAIVVLMAIGALVSTMGCYAIPKQDDPATAFDEASEETVVAGVPVYDQEAGTGAPFSAPVDGDPWWLTALQVAGTFMGGNVALGLASVRGRANLKNLFRMKSTWKSTAQSAVAMALPAKSPPEAEAIAATDAKAAAESAAKVSKSAKAAA